MEPKQHRVLWPLLTHKGLSPTEPGSTKKMLSNLDFLKVDRSPSKGACQDQAPLRIQITAGRPGGPRVSRVRGGVCVSRPFSSHASTSQQCGVLDPPILLVSPLLSPWSLTLNLCASVGSRTKQICHFLSLGLDISEHLSLAH